METTKDYRDYIRVYRGSTGDTGKENGNYRD